MFASTHHTCCRAHTHSVWCVCRKTTRERSGTVRFARRNTRNSRRIWLWWVKKQNFQFFPIKISFFQKYRSESTNGGSTWNRTRDSATNATIEWREAFWGSARRARSSSSRGPSTNWSVSANSGVFGWKCEEIIQFYWFSSKYCWISQVDDAGIRKCQIWCKIWSFLLKIPKIIQISQFLLIFIDFLQNLPKFLEWTKWEFEFSRNSGVFCRKWQKKMQISQFTRVFINFLWILPKFLEWTKREFEFWRNSGVFCKKCQKWCKFRNSLIFFEISPNFLSGQSGNSNSGEILEFFAKNAKNYPNFAIFIDFLWQFPNFLWFQECIVCLECCVNSHNGHELSPLRPPASIESSPMVQRSRRPSASSTVSVHFRQPSTVTGRL